MPRKRWRLPQPVPPDLVAAFPDIPPFFVQILHNRRITNLSDWRAFAAADERLYNDPFLMPGMAQAVERIQLALHKGESIAIYGDFDADGVTSTVLLTQALQALKGSVRPYIPHRLREGYGLNKPALERLRAEGVDLVITADCGINAYDEIRHAKAIGLDVIVTDHHSLTGPAPEASAVVCRGWGESTYPYSGLAGVGVAYKLVEALAARMGCPSPDHWLDIVALGTVADVAPIDGENRYLVKRGLEVLNRTQRSGLQQMMQLAALGRGQVDTEAISFTLAPRLNAAGRLDHAMLSYRLLATDSATEAADLASQLDLLNGQRQRLTAQVLERAREDLALRGPERPIFVLADERFEASVSGLVASRLVEEYCRPAVLIQKGEEISRGSCRSLPEFDIVAALAQRPDLFIRFGGHPLAAGFTSYSRDIPALEKHLTEVAEAELGGYELTPVVDIDAEISMGLLNREAFGLIGTLAPFGEGNRPPVFLSRGLPVLDCRTTNGGGEHLRLKLRGGVATWPAIGFGLGHLASQLGPRIDAVYTISADRFRQQNLLQLNLLDVAAHGSAPIPGKASPRI